MIDHRHGSGEKSEQKTLGRGGRERDELGFGLKLRWMWWVGDMGLGWINTQINLIIII